MAVYLDGKMCSWSEWRGPGAQCVKLCDPHLLPPNVLTTLVYPLLAVSDTVLALCFHEAEPEGFDPRLRDRAAWVAHKSTPCAVDVDTTQP